MEGQNAVLINAVPDVHTLDFGTSLDESTVKSGLRELCSGLHFDMGTNLGMEHPFQAVRQGIYYDGKYLFALDRAAIPEYEVWDMDLGHVDVPMVDVERYDDSHAVYCEILKTDPIYEMALEASQNHDDNYRWDDDKGKLFLYKCIRVLPVKNRIIQAGWWNTFNKLIASNLPGIDRRSIGEKFGVDMFARIGMAPEVVMPFGMHVGGLVV